jgi:hypothetical protein
LVDYLRRGQGNYDMTMKLIHEDKRKEFMLDKDSVNLHTYSRKRKLGDSIFTPAKDEVDAVFNETENMPTGERTKSYLRIKISSIIGK